MSNTLYRGAARKKQETTARMQTIIPTVKKVFCFFDISGTVQYDKPFFRDLKGLRKKNLVCLAACPQPLRAWHRAGPKNKIQKKEESNHEKSSRKRPYVVSFSHHRLQEI